MQRRNPHEAASSAALEAKSSFHSSQVCRIESQTAAAEGAARRKSHVRQCSSWRCCDSVRRVPDVETPRLNQIEADKLAISGRARPCCSNLLHQAVPGIS